MLELILTGRVQSFVLLLAALLFYLYLLPAILAFLRAHRGFYAILPLNVVLAPAQSWVMLQFFPTLSINPADPLAAMPVLLLTNFGPGWIALLAWALMPVRQPDPRLARARATKAYDLIAGLPLLLWFAYGALQLRPRLVAQAGQILEGTATLFVHAQFLALAASMLFNLLLVWLLLVRDRPVLKSRGAGGRIAAFLGTFVGVGMLQLPVADLSLSFQIIAALLVFAGSLASVLALARLGKSFSIMPEARRLVTTGPYAFARHPLYAAEMITVLGITIQFQQPWALIMGASVLALQVARTVYEERVLSEAFPEYALYRSRVRRFGFL